MIDSCNGNSFNRCSSFHHLSIYMKKVANEKTLYASLLFCVAERNGLKAENDGY